MMLTFVAGQLERLGLLPGLHRVQLHHDACLHQVPPLLQPLVGRYAPSVPAFPQNKVGINTSLDTDADGSLPRAFDSLSSFSLPLSATLLFALRPPCGACSDDSTFLTPPVLLLPYTRSTFHAPRFTLHAQSTNLCLTYPLEIPPSLCGPCLPTMPVMFLSRFSVLAP